MFYNYFLYYRAQKRLVNSQKYGVDLVRFTHAKNAAIHASTKRDDAIRYLSLHDNKVNTDIILKTISCAPKCNSSAYSNLSYTFQVTPDFEFSVHTLFYWTYQTSYKLRNEPRR